MKKIGKVRFYKHRNNNVEYYDEVEFYINQFKNIQSNEKLFEILKLDFPFQIICHKNGDFFKSFNNMDEFMAEGFGLNNEFGIRFNMDWIEDYLLNGDVWNCSYE